MKKLLFILFLGILSLNTTVMADLFGNSSEKIEALNHRVDSLNSMISSLKKEMGNKDLRIADLENTVSTLEKNNQELQAKVTEIGNTVNASIAQLNEQLDTKIKTTEAGVETNKKAADSIKTLLSIVITGLVLVLSLAAILYGVLRKRIGKGTSEIESIRSENKKLEEQTVQLDNRLAELLERQLKTDQNLQNISQKPEDAPDHSLAISVANEMARIEQNLSFMDPKTKGVSQLRNRAVAIAASLKDKGYEIPNLIGVEYKEGDNMEVVMEEDDTIEPDKMIIRRVNRPCVLYKGKMIQCAKVVVAYKPE